MIILEINMVLIIPCIRLDVVWDDDFSHTSIVHMKLSLNVVIHGIRLDTVEPHGSYLESIFLKQHNVFILSEA